MNSEALPSSKAYMNSQPSRPRPCSEYGQAGGEIPEVASFTSAIYGRPNSSSAVIRQDAVGHVGPLGELVPVHLPDAAGVSRMLTPEIVSATAKRSLA